MRQYAVGMAWPFALLAAITFAVVLFFMPWNADGCFAVNDALWYAHAAEHDGLASISGHHPLFHVLLLPLTGALDFVGADHPGHWATRCVNAAAFAGIVMLLGRLAGWRRTALALPLLLLATRSVLLEASVGETVVPAAALALWALVAACDGNCSLLRVGAITVAALLLRQDNILIVPGLVFALATRLPQQRRLWRMFLWLALTGLTTLGAYVICWQLAGAANLRAFMFTTAEVATRNWAPAELPGLDDLLLRCTTLGVAVAGVQHDYRAFTLNISIGLAFFVVLWAACRLLCVRTASTQPPTTNRRAMLWAVLLIAATRFCFYCWFEPQNFEWWILELLLGTALAAIHCPRSLSAAMLLLVAAATTFMLHATSTMALRDTTLHDAAAQAELWSHDPARPIVVTHGFRSHTAMHLRQVPHDPWLLLNAPTAESAGPLLTDYIARAQRPVILLLDRFVGDGHPAQAISGLDSLAVWVDTVPFQAPMRAWRQRGKAQVLWIPPLPR